MALIKCSDCGRDISDKAASCIHCGCPVIGAYYPNMQPHMQYQTFQQNSGTSKRLINSLAGLGFFLAILSVFLAFFFVLGIAALVLSIIGLVQIGRSGEIGRTIAILGIIFSGLSLIYVLSDFISAMLSTYVVF